MTLKTKKKTQLYHFRASALSHAYKLVKDTKTKLEKFHVVTDNP